MADQKISALTAITGANIVTSTDIIPLVDTSASQTKQITFDEFALALNISTASQAQMETASTSTVTVRPSMTHFHPGVAKAWGKITAPTTVAASYPATGVSNTHPGTGVFVVTFGRTMSSATAYAVLVNYDLGAGLFSIVGSKTATTFRVDFAIDTAFTVPTDPTSFDYVVFGDL